MKVKHRFDDQNSLEFSWLKSVRSLIVMRLEFSAVISVWIEVRRDHHTVWELSSCQILLCFLTINDRIKLHKNLKDRKKWGFLLFSYYYKIILRKNGKFHYQVQYYNEQATTIICFKNLFLSYYLKNFGDVWDNDPGSSSFVKSKSTRPRARVIQIHGWRDLRSLCHLNYEKSIVRCVALLGW